MPPGSTKRLQPCEQALTLNPQLASAHEQLGLTLHQKGAFAEALESFDRAIAIDPASAQTHVYHGRTLASLSRTEDAVAAYRRALILKPDDADLAARMEEDLYDKAVLDISILSHRERTNREPDNAGAHFDLGLALLHRRWFDAAIDAFRRVLALDPNHVAALNDLALLLAGKGQLDEAISLLRHAVNMHPEGLRLSQQPVDAAAFSSRFRCPVHLPRTPSLGSSATPSRFNRSSSPTTTIALPIDRSALVMSRRTFAPIRLADSLERSSPVTIMNSFEVFCYASLTRGDVITDRLRPCADHWVESVHLSDEALAQRIRNDRIDILVDLTMHLAHSRLLAFARKPAPIQVTYLAYCSTTGLSAMDYRLTDPHLDPPGQDLGCYGERSVHLPLTYWCYHPGLETPTVQLLPALSRGYVTFASLNNFSKVSPAALELWTRIMQATPRSHLIIPHCRG